MTDRETRKAFGIWLIQIKLFCLLQKYIGKPGINNLTQLQQTRYAVIDKKFTCFYKFTLVNIVLSYKFVYDLFKR